MLRGLKSPVQCFTDKVPETRSPTFIFCVLSITQYGNLRVLGGALSVFFICGCSLACNAATYNFSSL